jgi:ATP-dependent Clp protease ATP-binding subunit ClpC
MSAPVLTTRVQKVLDQARQEAIRLQHQYIEPEHIALGLLREGDGVAIAVLHEFHVDLAKLGVALETALADRPRALSGVGSASYNSASERALALANAAARSRRHMYVGTEHLLLGILADPMNVATQILATLGVSESAASKVTARLLGSPRAGA